MTVVVDPTEQLPAVWDGFAVDQLTSVDSGPGWFVGGNAHACGLSHLTWKQQLPVQSFGIPVSQGNRQ